VTAPDILFDGWWILQGRGLSPGVIEGRARVLDAGAWLRAARQVAPRGDPALELDRLHHARAAACTQLERIEVRLARQGRREDADIFAAQRVLLSDPVLEERIQDRIRDASASAERALADVIDALYAEFTGHPSPMIQDKATDVLDVGHRWLRGLDPEVEGRVPGDEPTIVVAAALTPSELVAFAHHGRCAAVTQECGARSHVAILARSMGVALVSGLPFPNEHVAEGDRLLVDGARGLVLVAPPDAGREAIDAIRAGLADPEAGLQIPRQPRTEDGVPIRLSLNISSPGEAAFVTECGADGVGLFRTEFFYMGRDSWPTEADCYAAWRSVAQAVGDGRLHIRLTDFGADKCPHYADFPVGRNPSLGLRGVRLLLERQDILAPQARALARLAEERSVVMLVPMLDGPDTLDELIASLEAICGRPREAFPFQLGAMVEVPAAALSIEALLDEVEHVSIGLNDLTQYVMAADREEEAVEQYHDPLTPAVLQLVDRVVAASQKRGRGVSICGELAGDPALTRVLLALGVRELSVSRPDYFRVADVIESLAEDDLAVLGEQIRAARSGGDVRRLSGRG